MTSLSVPEHQRLLRDAAAVLESQPGDDRISRAVKTGLEYALADHEDPEKVCSGEDCLAVAAARRVLAQYGPPEPQPEPGEAELEP